MDKEAKLNDQEIENWMIINNLNTFYCKDEAKFDPLIQGNTQLTQEEG